MKYLPAISASLLAVAFTGAACGGGGGGAGTGARVTDPALVPTSTPIQQPMTFRSVNDEIQVSSGGGTGRGPAATPQTHTVTDGQTCADIADQFGVTVEALIRANRNINADCTNLGAGDNLRIPSTSPTPQPGDANGTPTPTGGDGGSYEVADGDTCGAIAASFGVSVDELIALNGLDADCTSLQPGDVLQIP